MSFDFEREPPRAPSTAAPSSPSRGIAGSRPEDSTGISFTSERGSESQIYGISRQAENMADMLPEGQSASPPATLSGPESMAELVRDALAATDARPAITSRQQISIAELSDRDAHRSFSTPSKTLPVESQSSARAVPQTMASIQSTLTFLQSLLAPRPSMMGSSHTTRPSTLLPLEAGLAQQGENAVAPLTSDAEATHCHRHVSETRAPGLTHPVPLVADAQSTISRNAATVIAADATSPPALSYSTRPGGQPT